MITKMGVGIIGCGNVSSTYFQNCRSYAPLELKACADLDLARAEDQARAFDIPKACSTETLLADPSIDIIVNLTTPQAHAEVSLAAIRAGKHVYSEKPLATTREEGRAILDAAQAAGVMVGCGPDTFMGGGLQTGRRLLDDGAIGEPVAAVAFMMSRGPEGRHPNPETLYQSGAGPMFDMGPYYLTLLIHLLGPVRRVTGSARISFPERLSISPSRSVKRIHVHTPTHVVGVLEFTSGPIVTLITSFDVWAARLPYIEIYGSRGSLGIPDPNSFAGPVYICKAGAKEWVEKALTSGFTENSRGLGLVDMVYALQGRRPHRANDQVAYHVLDIMQAFDESARTGRHIELASSCSRPAPLPVGFNAIEMLADA